MASTAQLRRLVAALRTGDAAAKEAAVLALAKLADNNAANAAAIAEVGAIAPLIELTVVLADAEPKCPTCRQLAVVAEQGAQVNAAPTWVPPVPPAAPPEPPAAGRGGRGGRGRGRGRS